LEDLNDVYTASAPQLTRYSATGTLTATCQGTAYGGRIQPDSMDENLMNIARRFYKLESTLASVDQAEQAASQAAAGCGLNEDEF
jgi:hypothetical protein